MGSDKVFILVGRSFMKVMTSKWPKIDPLGTRCITVPQFEKKFGAALDASRNAPV
jgi:hypothetical protein